jgi:hypothetical protein
MKCVNPSFGKKSSRGAQRKSILARGLTLALFSYTALGFAANWWFRSRRSRSWLLGTLPFAHPVNTERRLVLSLSIVARHAHNHFTSVFYCLFAYFQIEILSLVNFAFRYAVERNLIRIISYSNLPFMAMNSINSLCNRSRTVKIISMSLKNRN